MTRPTTFDAYGGSGPENYERYFVPVLSGPLAHDLIERANLCPGARVLDVACGTGTVTRLAAERVGAAGSVAGLDINPGMLQVARSATPTDMAIAWHQSSAESIPVADEAFDVVLCQLGLQFVEDKPRALREMQRVLVHGGRLIVSVTGPIPPQMVVFGESLARHIGPDSSRFVQMIFSLYDPHELQDLVINAGFRDVAIEADVPKLRLPEPREFLWQYVYSTPLANAVAQADDASRAALERDVVAGWQAFIENGGMTLSPRMVIVTASKQ